MINVKSRAYVFDAYGTLFDVHAAIARHRAQAGSEAERFSEIWRTKQLEYTWTLTLAGHYRDFWALTERALDYAFARVPSVDRALRPKLLDAYLALDAFPDARTALAGLKDRGMRTAILSNGTPHMLRAATEASGTAELLDAVLSVDAVRLYKPRPEVYALVTDRFGLVRGGDCFCFLEPLGHYGRGVFRLPCHLGQSRACAGRIWRPSAGGNRNRSRGAGFHGGLIAVRR